MDKHNDSSGYWRANIRLILGSLVIWALFYYGSAILLRPVLAGFNIGVTDLGFWYAQQGSIGIFIVLIFFYAWRMNNLDKQYGVDEE